MRLSSASKVCNSFPTQEPPRKRYQALYLQKRRIASTFVATELRTFATELRTFVLAGGSVPQGGTYFDKRGDLEQAFIEDVSLEGATFDEDGMGPSESEASANNEATQDESPGANAGPQTSHPSADGPPRGGGYDNPRCATC
jgi:hypothetical protein